MADETTSAKPGYKTTEFWLAAAATIVGLLLASDVIPSGSNFDKVLGLVAATLTSMGYSAARAKTKSGA